MNDNDIPKDCSPFTKYLRDSIGSLAIITKQFLNSSSVEGGKDIRRWSWHSTNKTILRSLANCDNLTVRPMNRTLVNGCLCFAKHAF